ncbi:hypothetical protein QOL99_00365 [Deinococcus sp. MIMF12]|uniref:Zinc ribbon domain-containing protein n=1 Tax=Deinococcus rhizophilus TaxID=3049544 RepID=A0ABT7JC30_9DEIO|nr:hypothetical protein [Deinococcus rhizophilus]MDL2342601.1 hypothetical protein [Deinococcus rhizophilus]
MTSHAARNLAQIELLRRELATRPMVGCGYRPSAWCHHCGGTYDASLTVCPECDHPQAAPVREVTR